MIKIWDNHNKQWLDPMAIYFDHENKITRVAGLVPGVEPLKGGWYSIEKDDLNKIAIIGDIDFNKHLVPKTDETEDREVVCGYLKEGAIVSQKGYKTARAGRLVYETRDKYVVYLQSEVEGKPQARMTFYKETLDNLIDFDR